MWALLWTLPFYLVFISGLGLKSLWLRMSLFFQRDPGSWPDSVCYRLPGFLLFLQPGESSALIRRVVGVIVNAGKTLLHLTSLRPRHLQGPPSSGPASSQVPEVLGSPGMGVTLVHLDLTHLSLFPAPGSYEHAHLQ